MASTDYRHGSLNQSSAFYPPLLPQPQATWRSDPNHIIHPTALDRFEEQWRSQGRVVPFENANSAPRHERIRSPVPHSPNAPFYVPRPYESPAYQQQDRQDRTGPEPVQREQIYVQVNQAPRPPAIRPPIPTYQPWQRTPDMDRSSDHSRPPSNPHQSSPHERTLPRPATVPPQYRPQPQPRQRPESRSRRHNPYTESRRRRRSTSSQPRHPQKKRFTPPQHYQRQFPNRPSLL